MKRVFAALMVLLLAFTAYVFKQREETVKTTAQEASLREETKALRDALANKQNELQGKEPEILELAASQEQLMEVYGVWHARVENLQNLLSD